MVNNRSTYSSIYECALSCGKRVSARQDYCHACDASYTEMFGKEWYMLPWAAFLIQDQRAQARADALHERMVVAGSCGSKQ